MTFDHFEIITESNFGSLKTGGVENGRIMY